MTTKDHGKPFTGRLEDLNAQYGNKYTITDDHLSTGTSDMSVGRRLVSSRGREPFVSARFPRFPPPPSPPACPPWSALARSEKCRGLQA